jgi:hypothetical protein
MSNEVTTEQMNEAIALFMGYEQREEDYRRPNNTLVFLIGEYWTPIHKLKYHTSWDWLMPVVKKIRSMHFDILKQIGVLSYMNAAAPMNSALISIDIKKLHSGVYNFLLWYNQQKQTNDERGTNKG